MVDWTSQDRLYPSGYRAVDVRYSTSPTRSKTFIRISKQKKES